MTLQNIVWAIAIATTIVASSAWFFKKFIPAMRKWSRRVDGIFGSPADPATGALLVPSIFDRLSSQDEVLKTQNETLEKIVAAVNKAVQQVQNSHVTNLRDDVDEVIGKVDSLHDKLDDHLKATAAQPQTQININSSEPPTT